ncbi:hypothetical protein Pmani_027359 [Petrolisthes manimaculis]|uniref:Uncharacterized protein n=1 Tax=Petrolisthes manimaculis TaxID=1843537 RepID=A0AAE1TZ58_9EUCA|nr:hypothetical protein Pmani_027359 [Petrolisthes manimaculis]
MIAVSAPTNLTTGLGWMGGWVGGWDASGQYHFSRVEVTAVADRTFCSSNQSTSPNVHGTDCIEKAVRVTSR